MDAELYCRSPPLDTEMTRHAAATERLQLQFPSYPNADRWGSTGTARPYGTVVREPRRLVARLEARVRHDAVLERQYAAVEEALENIVNLNSRKPGEANGTEEP
jgi:hypothetical protein